MSIIPAMEKTIEEQLVLLLNMARAGQIKMLVFGVVLEFGVGPGPIWSGAVRDGVGRPEGVERDALGHALYTVGYGLVRRPFDVEYFRSESGEWTKTERV